MVLSAHKNTKLFDTIIEFCDKIKFLQLNNIDFMDISQLSKMIKMILNFNNCLKYLTLEVKFRTDSEDNLKLSSIILKELGKSLPLSLHYLDLKSYY